MWGFLRRIPELLGLKMKTKPHSAGPGLRVVAGGKDGDKKVELRGRGQGRGQTPPTPVKRSAARGPKSRKK